jgi:hypothetical protein
MIDGLHLLLAFIAALAGIGWLVDYRRRVSAERQRDLMARVATEKDRRLMAALDERDAARRHADDVQWVMNAMAGGQASARERHPSGAGHVRILHVIDGGA